LQSPIPRVLVTARIEPGPLKFTLQRKPCQVCIELCCIGGMGYIVIDIDPSTELSDSE